MDYPTMKEVEDASQFQLAKWYRFLPSPKPEQVRTMNRIVDRFLSAGGFNPDLSKAVGWDR